MFSFLGKEIYPRIWSKIALPTYASPWTKHDLPSPHPFDLFGILIPIICCRLSHRSQHTRTHMHKPRCKIAARSAPCPSSCLFPPFKHKFSFCPQSACISLGGSGGCISVFHFSLGAQRREYSRGTSRLETEEARGGCRAER